MILSIPINLYRRQARWVIIFALLLAMGHAFATQAGTQSTFLLGTPFFGRYAPETYSLEPFSQAGVQSSKYQQVYHASEFGLHGLPGVIEQVHFKTDESVGGPFSARIQIEVLFGITSRNPDQLSSTFAENVGTGLTMAFPHGEAFVFGPVVSLALQKPFTYDPALGNLLLEFRNYTPIPTFPENVTPSALDAWNIQGDSVSRVYAHDVNATTGIADTMGLTTSFFITPIPVLTVSLQSSNLVFRWGSYASRGFTLKQSYVLSTDVFWLPVSGTAVTNDAYQEVTVPLGPQTGTRFFRLVYSNPNGPFSPAGDQTGAGTIPIQDQKH